MVAEAKAIQHLLLPRRRRVDVRLQTRYSIRLQLPNGVDEQISHEPAFPMLGRRIDRSVLRHYVGRVFATLAGSLLAVHAYDSQCGAKFFRDSPALRATLGVPFRSRWGFDLELLGRLQGCGVGADRMREEPLNEWRDVSGSKVTARSGLRTFWELLAIRRDLRQWAHEHGHAPEVPPAP